MIATARTEQSDNGNIRMPPFPNIENTDLTTSHKCTGLEPDFHTDFDLPTRLGIIPPELVPFVKDIIHTEIRVEYF